MRRTLIVAALALMAQPAAAADWWRLAPTNPSEIPPVLDTCVPAAQRTWHSPGDAYQAGYTLGRDPTLSYLGDDEVDVDMDYPDVGRRRIEFFRTQLACVKAAAQNHAKAERRYIGR
jgi:hypothetical protein